MCTVKLFSIHILMCFWCGMKGGEGLILSMTWTRHINCCFVLHFWLNGRLFNGDQKLRKECCGNKKVRNHISGCGIKMFHWFLFALRFQTFNPGNRHFMRDRHEGAAPLFYELFMTFTTFFPSVVPHLSTYHTPCSFSFAFRFSRSFFTIILVLVGY